MKKLIIFGCGEAAELAHYYFTKDAGRQVAAFTVDGAFLTSACFCGLPTAPFEEVELAFPPSEYDFFVAVGYKQLNRLRAQKVAEAKAKGYALVSYCSSHATNLSDHALGENCLVVEGSILQPFCRLGNNVTIMGGVIGHHSVIGDNCFIAGYVAGGVTVGPNCFIGLSALLRSHIAVGENCIIGIGAVVLSDVEAYSVLQAQAARHAQIPSHRVPSL